MRITTKQASNSPVTFVPHKGFAVLLLPSCCVNSLLLHSRLCYVEICYSTTPVPGYKILILQGHLVNLPVKLTNSTLLLLYFWFLNDDEDIYNSLTIHGLSACDTGVPKSVLEINNFWRKTSYNIGGYIFSLDDIEHGILRGTNFFLFLCLWHSDNDNYDDDCDDSTRVALDFFSRKSSHLENVQ